jgi:hypothetical protein
LDPLSQKRVTHMKAATGRRTPKFIEHGGPQFD